MSAETVHNPVKALIDGEALQHNLCCVKKRAPRSKVISVIKANAYGHGMIQAARALHDSDKFAVARIDEALTLRQQGISKPIMLLEGMFVSENIQQQFCLCHQFNFVPVFHCRKQLVSLIQFAKTRPDLCRNFNYWLKLDTGMHRLGFAETELQAIVNLLKNQTGLAGPLGIMSHFACADEKNNPLNRIQQQLFKRLYSECGFADAEKSMANSAAILSLPEVAYDWVRPGIMLYGVSPFTTGTGLNEGLKPVMTLTSKVIAVKHLNKGDTIGYGCSWRCPQDMPVGVIAIGYGDGYPRHAQSGTPVLINGIQVPLVGRVSMDMITVDLRAFGRSSKAVQVGDDVTLWGQGLPIEWVARKASTIGYELLCQVTRRVHFEYLNC